MSHQKPTTPTMDGQPLGCACRDHSATHEPFPIPTGNPEPDLIVNRKSSIVTRKRNGKVACLSKTHRDLVNHMLQDGASYCEIVAALNELGITVSARNISNWYRGGYRDWLDAQERVATTRIKQDALLDLGTEDPTALPQVGLQLAATRLTELLLLSQPAPTAPEANLNQYLHLANGLCRITRLLLKLQEYADDAESSHESPPSLEPFLPPKAPETAPSPTDAPPAPSNSHPEHIPQDEPSDSTANPILQVRVPNHLPASLQTHVATPTLPDPIRPPEAYGNPEKPNPNLKTSTNLHAISLKELPLALARRRRPENLLDSPASSLRQFS